MGKKNVIKDTSVAGAIKEDIGYHPAFVGMSAIAGAEAINKFHPASIGAQLAYVLSDNVERIPEIFHGERIDGRLGLWAAGFSGKDSKAIRDFKKSVIGKAKLPMYAADASYAYPIGHGDISVRGKLVAPASERSVFLDTTSAPVAMHEIAHTSPLLGGRYKKLSPAWHTGARAARALKFPLMLQATIPPDEDSGRVRRFLYDNAPALVGATYAPTLIEEIRATTKAFIGSRKAGISAGRVARDLLPAFGTYVGTGLIPPVLATVLGKRLIEHLYKKKRESRAGGEQEKKAAAVVAVSDMIIRKMAQLKPSGAMKNSISVAYSSTPPMPKSTPVSGPRRSAADQTGARASIPSKTKFYNDSTKSNVGLGGNRIGVNS